MCAGAHNTHVNKSHLTNGKTETKFADRQNKPGQTLFFRLQPIENKKKNQTNDQNLNFWPRGIILPEKKKKTNTRVSEETIDHPQKKR